MARSCTPFDVDHAPVVIVDDDAPFLYSCALTIRNAGIEAVHTIGDSRELLPFLARSDAAVVVLDLCMPHVSGMDLLVAIKEGYPHVPVIVATGSTNTDIAVHCMKAGAFDYLVKPVSPCCYVTRVKRAIERREPAPELSPLGRHVHAPGGEDGWSFFGIVTRNDGMKAVIGYAEAIAGSSHPALITGETGVGKELIARAIHSLSRRGGPFVAVNVAGLDDAVFSDTLLGHRKGAFTGAQEDRKGMLAQASGGTLFLDEIGDLETRSQVKLLRLLEEKAYYPLGSDRMEKTDARILCATNRDVPALVSAGVFRNDLYYRLRSHHVHVPPLRARMDDLPLLVDCCLERAARSLGKRKPTPPAELVTLLRTYHFPGNVRELQSLICDAVARHRGGVLSIESIQEALAGRRGPEERPTDGGPPAGGAGAPFEILTRFPTRREADDYLVSEALRRADGNQGIAANLLGISREALNKRLARRRLSREEPPGHKAA